MSYKEHVQIRERKERLENLTDQIKPLLYSMVYYSDEKDTFRIEFEIGKFVSVSVEKEEGE